VIAVPVEVDDASGLESLRLAVAFDPDALELAGVRRGGLTADFGWFIERRAPGRVVVDASRLSPLAGGQGSLLELDLRWIGRSFGESAIDLEDAVLNDRRLTLGAPPRPGNDPSDGRVSFSAPLTPSTLTEALVVTDAAASAQPIIARLAPVGPEPAAAPPGMPERMAKEALPQAPLAPPVVVDLAASPTRFEPMTTPAPGQNWRLDFVNSARAPVARPNATLRVTLPLAPKPVALAPAR
jgi:hypothetical protein